jgi:hypothetical protein
MLRLGSSAARLLGLRNSNPAADVHVCLRGVLCAVKSEASATRRSLVQGSTTECARVHVCDHVQR